MKPKNIWTIACIGWFGILCLAPNIAYAGNTVGTGFVYQNGYPFVLASTRLWNFGIDLRLGVAAYSVMRNGNVERVSAASAIGSVKLYIPFRFPVVPYLEIGGIATTVQLSQSFGDRNANTASSTGILFVTGMEYELPWFPLDIFASLNISTIRKIKLLTDPGSQSSLFEVPVQGLSGISWSVGFRYEFLFM